MYNKYISNTNHHVLNGKNAVIRYSVSLHVCMYVCMYVSESIFLRMCTCRQVFAFMHVLERMGLFICLFVFKVTDICVFAFETS